MVSDKNSSVRLIVAIILSALLMVIFNVFFSSKPQVSKEEARPSQAEAVQKEQVASVPVEQKHQSAVPVSETKLKPEQKMIRETQNYLLEFSDRTGALTRLSLKKYLDQDGKNIEATPQPSSRGALFYGFENMTLDGGVFQENSDGSLTYIQENSQLRVEKQMIFPENAYHLQVKMKIFNKSKDRIQIKDMLAWEGSIGPFPQEKERTQYDETVETSYFDKEKNAEEKISGETVMKTQEIDWLGMDGRYFFVALIPDQLGKQTFKIQNEDKIYDEKLELYQDLILEPSSVLEKSYTVYMGPKDEGLLKSYQRNLEAITERGWPVIGPIIVLLGKGIKFLLFWINSFIGNFGITIVILSLLFKVILNPLTTKSMDSARKMQALQPQIEALKKKYTDPKEMNAKIWELYRREKINPMGGCLPMILQMPFFFALYQVLPYVVELKNVHFLWIRDLSSPDTVAYLEFFKDIPLLPYRLNIMPLLLTVFSFVQTKVSQGGNPATGQGKMMEYLMPIMFLFIFWNMPSGLVVYWLMQTLFTIVHQWIKNKRPPKKNDREDGPKNKKKLKPLSGKTV